MMNDVNTVTSFTTFSEWRKNVHYKEMLEQVAVYNKYLRNERQDRLPYLDSQTGVAQSDCFIWRSRSQRRRGNEPGQVYSYPPIKWKMEFHRDIPNVPTIKNSSVSMAPAQVIDKGPVIKRSTHAVEELTNKKTTADIEMSAVQSDDSDSVDRGGDNSNAVVYNDSSSSSGDEAHVTKRKSTRKSNGSRSRTTTTTRQTNSQVTSTPKEEERPFVCNICGRRYKTLSVLKAHRTTYHSQEAFSHVEERHEKRHDSGEGGSVMEIRDAKPNGYCDFCLGDDNLNKKTGKPEKLVSCADCGRSGHPSCLQFSPALMEIVMTYRWQCIECKSCHLCGQSDNDDQLLFCDDCDRGYHMYCVSPPIKEPPEGSWSCNLCVVRLASTARK
ncbi:zinc finger protein ubi-d4-like isoform X2 [Dysidea avara]|uniref:zinc finger protein ubi-d4-like isoform X2 n=1 Tax=Dysidea avara TaxID=196820 RepID=UPI00332ADC3A